MRSSIVWLSAPLLISACSSTELDQSSVDTSEVDRNLEVAAIVDVNPNSATFEAEVVPADYQGMVSAWYFGHAT